MPLQGLELSDDVVLITVAEQGPPGGGGPGCPMTMLGEVLSTVPITFSDANSHDHPTMLTVDVQAGIPLFLQTTWWLTPGNVSGGQFTSALVNLHTVVGSGDATPTEIFWESVDNGPNGWKYRTVWASFVPNVSEAHTFKLNVQFADAATDEHSFGGSPSYPMIIRAFASGDCEPGGGTGGLPVGGTTDQVLAKASNADFDVEWQDSTVPVGVELQANKGQPNGYQALGAGGKAVVSTLGTGLGGGLTDEEKSHRYLNGLGDFETPLVAVTGSIPSVLDYAAVGDDIQDGDTDASQAFADALSVNPIVYVPPLTDAQLAAGGGYMFDHPIGTFRSSRAILGGGKRATPFLISSAFETNHPGAYLLAFQGAGLDSQDIVLRDTTAPFTSAGVTTLGTSETGVFTSGVQHYNAADGTKVRFVGGTIVGSGTASFAVQESDDATFGSGVTTLATVTFVAADSGVTKWFNQTGDPAAWSKQYVRVVATLTGTITSFPIKVEVLFNLDMLNGVILSDFYINAKGAGSDAESGAWNSRGILLDRCRWFNLERLWINKQKEALRFRSCWDSNVFDVKVLKSGVEASTLPAWTIEPANVYSKSSNSNQITLTQVHCEDNKYTSIYMGRRTRRVRWVGLKCHGDLAAANVMTVAPHVHMQSAFTNQFSLCSFNRAGAEHVRFDAHPLETVVPDGEPFGSDRNEFIGCFSDSARTNTADAPLGAATPSMYVVKGRCNRWSACTWSSNPKAISVAVDAYNIDNIFDVACEFHDIYDFDGNVVDTLNQEIDGPCYGDWRHPTTGVRYWWDGSALLPWGTAGGAVSPHAATHGDGGADEITLDASQTTTGVFNIARLATGTPDGTKFVRDDGTLALPPGGGGGGLPSGAVPGGGDLAGSYPSPTVIDDSHNHSSTTLTGVVKSGDSAGGGLTGTYPNPTLGINSVDNAAMQNGSVGTAELQANAVTNAILADIATNTIKGRVTAGTGDPETLTAAQARTVIASDSGGGTTNFLRADGTWSAPAGGGPPTGAATGDLSGFYPNPSVVDDSHAHTGTTISALDAGDTTTGTFAAARLGSGSASSSSWLRGDSTWQAITAATVGAVDAGAVGAINGVASLDASGFVPDGQLSTGIARLSQVVNNSLFDVNSIIKSDVDNTPARLDVALDTLVGRATGVASGVITALTKAQVKTMLAIATADIVDFDATLSAIAGVTFAANTMLYATAADTFATTPLTAFSRTLLDDADAAAWKDTLGLNALVPGARIDLPAPSGGSQVIDVDMSEGQAGAQIWNGGLNDSDTLTINANAGTNAAQLTLNSGTEVEVNTATFDLNATGALTIDAVTNTFFGTFGNSLNNMTVTGTADETGTGTPTALYVIDGAASNDNVQERTYTSKILTTGATATPAMTITNASIANSVVVHAEAKILAHRTSGSGAAGDSASYVCHATFKDDAGTLTQVGTTTATHTGESVAGWNATIDASSNNVRVMVTGAATTNISWGVIMRFSTMGT